MNAALKDYQATTTSILDGSQNSRRLLYTFTALAGLVAIQIMHLALDDLKINAALTGGLIGGFVYSYLLPRRFRALTTYFISGLSVIIAMIYYLRIRGDATMLGTYLGILAGILMVLLAFKAFAPGDHRFILMFSVVFLLFSSVASYDLKFMLLLPLFLVFSGCSLYLANQVDVSVRVSGTAGRRFQLKLGFGQGFASVLARAVAGIILLASVAYIVAPHSGGAHSSMFLNTSPKVDRAQNGEDVQRNPLDSQNGSDEVEVGLSANFDLTDTRKLSSDPRPVLKVRSHRMGYLRAQVFDVYTGSGWERSENLAGRSLKELRIILNPYLPAQNDENSFVVPLVDFPGESYAESLKEKQGIDVVEKNVYSTSEGDLDYDIVRQEVVLLEEQLPFYFSTYQPFKLENVSLDRNSRLITKPLVDGASILRPHKLDEYHPEGFSYTVFALEPRVSKTKLDQVVGKPDERVIRQYTQLPLSAAPSAAELGGLDIPAGSYRPISQRLRNFSERFNAAGEGQAGAINTWQTVQSIIAYLTDEDEFSYTRQFNPLDSDQEVTEAFCLGTQEGYCRYFASSMAVLCRLNNIPARIVTGYSPGTFSLVDNAYIYKASNAHVWTEVYFNGYGWIMFDPSPTAAGPTDTGGALQWLNGTLNFLQELFVLDPASTRETIWLAITDAWSWAAGHGNSGLAAAGIMLVLLVLYLTVLQLRLRRAPARIRPQNEVVASYIRLKSILARAGHSGSPSATARRLLGDAGRKFPQLEQTLNEFIPVYEGAAYSGVDAEPEDGVQAKAAVETVAEFAREQARLKKKKK